MLDDLTPSSRDQLLLVSTTFNIPYQDLLKYPYIEYSHLLSFALTKSQTAIIDKKLSDIRIDNLRLNSNMKGAQIAEYQANANTFMPLEEREHLLQKLKTDIMVQQLEKL